MYQNFLYNGTTNSRWHSVYIFTDKGLDDAIKVILLPFTDFFYHENRIVSQFFFIRYWEKGAHLRLRFKISNLSSEQEELTKILAFIHEKLEQLLGSQINNQETIKEHNFIKIEQYEPEYNRYGGEYGILLAEQLFQLSSLTVLEMIRSTGGREAAAKIASAIQLHWVFNKVLLATHPEPILGIYHQAFKGWLPNYMIADFKDLDEQSATITQKFSSNFIQQKKQILDMISLIDQELTTCQDRDEWLKVWSEGLTILSAAFNDFKRKKFGDILHVSRESKAYLNHIVGSYIHMTNNRLGVNNIDESFIGYIMERLI